MPFVLKVQQRDRARRFILDVGTHTIGSSSECSVCVSHPTVSRRHARLTVTENGVSLSDLGSSNGTWIDGKRINNDQPLNPATVFSLGSVDACLEEIEADEVEIAVSLPTSAAVSIQPSFENAGGDPVSTVGPAALQQFSLVELPSLVGRLVARESPVEIAQAFGEALWRTMPCRSVEILRLDGSEDAVLFCAVRSATTKGSAVSAASGSTIEVRVSFVAPAHARIYEPLLRIAAGLISLAEIDRFPSRRQSDPASEGPRPPDPPSVVAEVRDLYAQAARIARGPVSVLIRGESGTGKELLAQFIHDASQRGAEPLVILNCAALPRDLLESELFGVEPGVATGVDARAGKFEAAHGGTLFLDEIGDMAAETQARILRVLQEKEVFRIGGQNARPADVRVISATNRNLEGMIRDGSFRSDLYHRIADWEVELPPLRRRRGDIANLAAHFLAHACEERGVNVAGISRAAVEALESFSWPGNVRQLEREMGRTALFLEDNDVLDSSLLQPAIVQSRGTASVDALKVVLDQAERMHIERVLSECDGVVAAAADRLELGLSTLYRRMKALGIGE